MTTTGSNTAWLLAGGAALLVAVPLAAPAAAQTPSPQSSSPQPASTDIAPDDIVVTAQKRSERLQTTALSVQAVNGANIEARALRSLQDLTRLVPSLSIAPETGIGDRNIVLRGVAPSGGTQPTVVTYLDDILIPNSVDPQLYDLQRVEVLKGPQGDLYGASAAGGLIHYVEARPDPSAIAVRAEASAATIDGGGENYGGAAVLNLPVAATAALRGSVVYDRRGGFIDNVDPYTGARRTDVNGVERFTGRLAGLWTPSDALDLRASLLYNRRSNGALSESDRNDRLPAGTPGALTTSRFFPESGSDRSWIFNVTADVDLGIGTITSATGYVSQKIRRRLDTRDIYNLDPAITGFSYAGFDPAVNGPFVGNPNTALLSPFVTRNAFRQFTQEVRFSSEWDFPVQLLAGVFYLRGTTRSFQRLGFDAPIPEYSVEVYGGDPGALVDAGFTGRERVEEIAGFVNLRWRSADERVELKGGARYYDRRNPRRIVDSPGALFPNAVDATAKDSGTLFSASASYKVSPTLFAYARYAGGFRPGVGRPLPGPICNPDFEALGIDPTSIPPFTRAETLDSYEAGVRASSRDGRFSANLAGFVIKYRDIQQSLVLPTCASIFDVNAGRATSRGFELETRFAPSRALSIAINVGYTDSRLDEGDPFSGGDRGEQLQFVPAWTFSVQQDYRAPIAGAWDMVLRSDLSFTDRRQTQFGLPGAGPEAASMLPDYVLLNAQVGVARRNWEFILFADNLANTLPVYGTNQTRYFGTDGRTWSVGTPRTLGLRVRSSF